MRIKRHIRSTWPCAIACLGIVAGVPAATTFAQQRDTTAQRDAVTDRQFTPRLEKANRLIGLKVHNRQGDAIGSIEDIVLDQGQRRVSYAVLAFGGFLGIGQKLFAIPWSALEITNPVGDNDLKIVTDITEQRLEGAPGFDRNNWPDMGDPQWARNVNEFHRRSDRDRADADRTDRTARDDRRQFWVRRLTKVIGTNVKNRSAENLGEIEDIVVDTREGALAYAIVSTGGLLDIRGKQIAVPWDALESQPVLGTFLIDADKDTLESLAFDRNQYPDLADRQYSDRLHERFQSRPYWDFSRLLPGSEENVDSYAAWRAESEYNRQYDPANTVTVRGTVESVGTFSPESGAADGLRLTIKTDSGDSIIVHGGPERFAEQRDVRFHYGDKVEVTGVKADTWRGDVIIAGKITNGDKTIRLRDDQGKPRWNTDQLTSVSDQDTRR